MKKIIKTFYLVVIALVVFLGGLLICQGVSSRGDDARVTPAVFLFKDFDSQEGSAM